MKHSLRAYLTPSLLSGFSNCVAKNRSKFKKLNLLQLASLHIYSIDFIKDITIIKLRLPMIGGVL